MSWEDDFLGQWRVVQAGSRNLQVGDQTMQDILVQTFLVIQQSNNLVRGRVTQSRKSVRVTRAKGVAVGEHHGHRTRVGRRGSLDVKAIFIRVTC